MATIQSPSPSSLPGPTPPSSSSSRRLPPPCWSYEETIALIDAYRDKWYSLRRGNLRSSHWQEVADAVGDRYPLPSDIPPKTSVQCRHKMEKLRKRYRAEIQRAASNPKSHRCNSSWVHFKRMDLMEKGPASAVTVNSGPVVADEDDEDGDDEDDGEEQELFYPKNVKSATAVSRISNGTRGSGIVNGPVRIRIPGRSSMPPPPVVAKVYGKFDEFSSYSGKHNPNPNYGSTRVLKNGSVGRYEVGKSGGGGGEGVRKRMDPVAEMAAAIKVLGDGFVKMERMKMEMAREVEAMRMDMELKRTEMVLDSQQQIVEAFAKACSDRSDKKVKQMPTLES
ncbi:hypothetical protein RJ639_013608 [Escallonia herrerae]|uniref:Myb-like domain-containing protein n=1 Tax=Escallonia herrerae TaxID=1293975 RepID=A0AA88VFS4_9ASTE|nr:hypothetical protein RJ639_013608 [Escallonia herrerae]